MPEGTPHLSLDPVTGQPVAQYPDGTVVPVSPTATPQLLAPGLQGGTNANGLPGGAAAPDPRFTAPAGDAGTDRLSGGYAPSGRSAGRGSSGTRRSYDYDTGYAPRYADGSLHPAQGGYPRTPGGPAAGRVEEFDDRQQVYVPGGAAAGPVNTSAASNRPWQAERALGGYSGGGGGGGTSPLYDALRAKGNAMEAKVRGMASGIGSGGSSYGGSSYSSYDSGGVAAPREPIMRGLARGMDPGQAAEVGFRPTFLLPKLFPGASGASPFYQQLSALPAAQLGMLSKRNYDGGPSDLVNAVGTVYQRAGGPRDALPDFETVMRNLTNPKQGGGIDTMFQGQKAGPGDAESYTNPGYVYGAEPPPAGMAAQTYGGMLDAALSLLPAETAMKYGSAPGGYGSYLIDKWGSRALKKPAGKGKPVNTYVGRRLGI